MGRKLKTIQQHNDPREAVDPLNTGQGTRILPSIEPELLVPKELVTPAQTLP